jgi:hypothetical protein
LVTDITEKARIMTRKFPNPFQGLKTSHTKPTVPPFSNAVICLVSLIDTSAAPNISAKEPGKKIPQKFNKNTLTAGVLTGRRQL